ncbi:MAG: TVP38/TMEM64 family protein [Hyphomicrobiales bacterium]|nr:TVP38/TMEM64 family protein [Hyphomicrobiales bacterium]MBV9431132.1 TVP38/TMEM64 family protein [Hyphomicrobiales bacterium]
MGQIKRASSLMIWLVVAALLLAAGFGWSLLPLREWVTGFDAWIQGLGIWGPIVFLLVYVIAIVLLVPASVMTLAAGLAFGLAAIPLVVVAASTGAALAFLLARHFIKRDVRRLIEGRPRAQAIYRAVSGGGWQVVFLLRLSPVMPFSVLNFVLGATELRFLPFVCATFVGIIPAVVLYVYVATLGKAAIAGTMIGTARWVLLLLGLAATLAAIIYIGRAARAELEKGMLLSKKR